MRERLKSLRMPLNRKRRRSKINAFHGFNDPPARHRQDAKASANRLGIHRLMVSAVDGGNSDQDFRELRFYGEGDSMSGVFSVRLSMPFAATQDRRNMLNQFPAERDIQNLDPAADSENGLFGFHESLDKPALEFVTMPIHAIGFGRW